MHKKSSLFRYTALFVIIFLVYSISNIVQENLKNNKKIDVHSGESLWSFQNTTSENESLKILVENFKNTEIDTSYSYGLCVQYTEAKNSNPDMYYHVQSAQISSLARLDEDIIKSNFTKFCEDKKIDLSKIESTFKLTKIKNKKIKLDAKTHTLKNIGDITFCLEDTMLLGDTYRAMLIISKEVEKRTIENLQKMAFPDGVPQMIDDTITIANKIFASLMPTLSEQFKIVQSEPDSVKTIDLVSKDFVIWEWLITPIKEGKNNLILKVKNLDKSKGSPRDFFPSKIYPIKVFTEKKTFFEKTKGFLADEWKWGLTSIVGVIGWVLVYFQNKKS